MVVLDSDHSRDHVLKELEAWAPVVTVGSCLIVEDTNLSGNPIDKQGKPGPGEAIKEWLPQHPEFIRDGKLEKFFLTSNPGGWLRRIR